MKNVLHSVVRLSLLGINVLNAKYTPPTHSRLNYHGPSSHHRNRSHPSSVHHGLNAVGPSTDDMWNNPAHH